MTFYRFCAIDPRTGRKVLAGKRVSYQIAQAVAVAVALELPLSEVIDQDRKTGAKRRDRGSATRVTPEEGGRDE